MDKKLNSVHLRVSSSCYKNALGEINFPDDEYFEDVSQLQTSFKN